jgi:hypothetical protein
MGAINSTTLYPVVTPAGADTVLISDASDSNATKTATIASIAVAAQAPTAFVYEIELGSTTDADPTDGLLKFNHATPSSATFLYIDDAEANLIDLSTYYASLPAVGWVMLFSRLDPAEWMIFKWSAITDGAGYFKFAVVHQASAGSFVDADDVLVSFYPGNAVTSGTLAQFAATTSAQLAGVISDETGSGALVFANAPTLVNPVVGTQSAADNSTKAASTAYVDAAVSGILTVMENSGGTYVATERSLFIRRAGDPDPTSSMADGDLLIDLSTDTVPGSITFAAKSSALPSFTYTSATHTLSGLTGAADVTITGGEWRKSSDSGSTYTSWGTASGVASNGDYVQVRGVANASAAGVTTVALTVGGVTGNYVITTAATVEEFNGSAGAYTGGTLFDVGNAGTGTTTLDGSGGMVQTSTAASAAAIARRKTAFNSATVQKYRRHFNLTATSGAMVFALQKNLNSNASQLDPTVNATWGTNNRNICGIADDGVFFYRDTGNVAVLYNAGTNAWGSSGAVTLSTGVDYVVEIESDGTNMRMALYDSTDTLIEQTPTVPWSSILSLNSYTFVSFGDYLTDFWTVTGTTYTYTEG